MTSMWPRNTPWNSVVKRGGSLTIFSGGKHECVASETLLCSWPLLPHLESGDNGLISEVLWRIQFIVHKALNIARETVCA